MDEETKAVMDEETKAVIEDLKERISELERQVKSIDERHCICCTCTDCTG